GSSTALNFPTSHLHHLPATVMSPKSIERVAAAVAKATTTKPFATGTTTIQSPSPPPY
ncbi:unnamed protein product, partial [Musa hybrid cultivar]